MKGIINRTVDRDIRSLRKIAMRPVTYTLRRFQAGSRQLFQVVAICDQGRRMPLRGVLETEEDARCAIRALWLTVAAKEAA